MRFSTGLLRTLDSFARENTGKLPKKARDREGFDRLARVNARPQGFKNATFHRYLDAQNLYTAPLTVTSSQECKLSCTFLILYRLQNPCHGLRRVPNFMCQGATDRGPREAL